MCSYRTYLVIGLLALLCACSPVTKPEVGAPQSRPNVIAKRVTVTEADDGGRVALSVGDTLAVVLPGNPSTGYAWEVAKLPKGLLASAGDIRAASGSGRLGAGGEDLFLFNVLRSGQGQMRLVYRRPFEQAAPAEKFEIHITIKR